MARVWSRLRQDDGGAVAPMVGLSLFALLAVGGVAFDYARLATMDTELQDAADQAALAAASQLDGQSGAVARATAAAQNLLSNRSLLANDGSGMAVTLGTPVFYAAKADAEAANGVNCPTANSVTADAQAKYVCVKTANRTGRFALTPVVGALNSGNIAAMAVASMSSSICKVPPVMMCNPAESTDPSFTTANYVGKGIKLLQGGGGSWTAGNFGYLDHSGGSNGDTGLREDLGWTAPPGDCQAADGVDTKPGVNAVNDAINTRFDIYDGNSACVGSGSCPPSINSVKDVVRAGNASGNNACKIHNQGWHLSSNYYGNSIPTTASALLTTQTPDAMGHPRDMCHAVSSTGSCTNGRIGDGTWDRDAYFRTNYVRSGGTYWSSGTGVGSWQANTGLSPSVATSASNYASRYNVYKWEIANRGTTVDGVAVLASRIASGSGAGADRAYGSPVCSQLQSPSYGTGTIPSATTVDRRKLAVAVANCATADHGGTVKGNSTGVTVKKWVEVFLVEPSLARARTDEKEVYVEVIGETSAGSGSSSASLIRHDVPYLIK